MRFKIPNYAKDSARKGLQLRQSLPEYKKFGLDRKEANELGINSGVERAKQLIKNDSVNLEDAKAIAKFWLRWKSRSSPKIEGSLLLWGGRKWGQELYRELRKLGYF